MERYHTVSQGEHLTSIAKDYHFSDYRTIYNHPENKDFKDSRPDPNVIFPGDVIFIPNRDTKEESGQTEKRHRFKLRPPKTMLRLVIEDDEGQPQANAQYKLKVLYRQKERTYTGTTNRKGLLEKEIPTGAQDAYLAFDRLGLYWSLKIGHLDPIEEPAEEKPIVTGVQARLNNLGFDCGKVDGVLGPKTKEAIKQFQEQELKRESPTGDLDKQTLEELSKLHRC